MVLKKTLFYLFTTSCLWWRTNSADSEVLPEFRAVLGSTAHLTCQVPHRPPSSGIKCIFWYKDDEVMSMYTVDARETTETLHVPSDRLRSRAHFEPSPWPPVLRLVSVQESDAGVYYCRVDYRWDRTYMHTVVLKVIVPPRKLSILNEHDEEITGMAGPYLEGQSVKLTCEAVGGKPIPRLSWWRGNLSLSSGPSVAFHGHARIDFSFIPTRSDLLTFLTCRSDNNVTAPTTVSVQINLYLKPIDVRVIGQQSSLSSGRLVEVKCESSGSTPAARMSWFLDNEALSNHTEVVAAQGRESRTSSSLVFLPSRSDHGKYLRCRAENYLLSDSALEDGWHLNVTYVPQVTLSIRSQSKKQHSSFLEGDNVRFNCEVKANPPASREGWLFDDRPIDLGDPEIKVNTKSMQVMSVRRRHRGRYQCYANNTEGTGFSRVVNLRALYAPVCRSSDLRKTYAVPTGGLERVECRVEADPPSVEFEWSFSNAVDRHFNVSFTSAALRSVATYTPRTARDYGTLYCWGKNAVGEQHEPCMFFVIPKGPPETLQNCTSDNVTTTSVTIVCIRGPRQDSDLRYYLDIFRYQSDEVESRMSSGTPYFVVNNLTVATEFLFVVYAVNNNGKSAPQMVRVWTLRSPSEERIYSERSSPSDSWLGPSLLVLTALSCFLMFAGAAVWSRFRGGPGCQKCKELPKQLHFKKSFSNRMKTDKNYIDCQKVTQNGHLAHPYVHHTITSDLEIKPSII